MAKTQTVWHMPKHPPTTLDVLERLDANHEIAMRETRGLRHDMNERLDGVDQGLDQIERLLEERPTAIEEGIASLKSSSA